jgi:hypothetical protein
VPRSELSAAVALNSTSFNLARAVGPALGGLIVAAAGTAAVFLLNAASFLGVLIVLCHWHRPQNASLLPPEHVFGAMRAGVRYVRHAPALHAVLLQVGSFIVCGTSLWALLPLIARHDLGLGAFGYGGLLGCLGLGAVAGAVLLPRIQQKVAINPLVAGATSLFAATTLVLAYVHSAVLVSAAMMAGGMAWMMLMSTLTVAVQTAVPAWVRARALAMYMLVFRGPQSGYGLPHRCCPTHCVTLHLCLCLGRRDLTATALFHWQIDWRVVLQSWNRMPQPSPIALKATSLALKSNGTRRAPGVE